MATSFVRRATVQARLGVGRTKLQAMIDAGEFPAPLKISGGVWGWPDTDLTTFIDNRIAAERGQPEV